MKKVISILLVVFMLLSSAPLSGFVGLELPKLTASAAKGGTYGDLRYIEYGTFIEITDCDTSVTSVEIPSIINGKKVTRIGRGAFLHCSYLQNITLPDSLLIIDNGAFRKCWKLLSITIPDSVTTIGKQAFFDCSNLTSITISDSVTSIGEEAFMDCRSLKSIAIPKSISNIGKRAFFYCSSLMSITIPDSVTSIGEEAFKYTDYYANGSNWENGVLYIGNHLIDAKYNISGDYTIKNGTKTIADYAFCGFSNLSSITIPNSVTSIGNGAFCNCSDLSSITIPNSVSIIGGDAFYNTAYYNSKENWENGVLYIGNHLIKAEKDISSDYKVKDGTKSILDGAFDGCSNLSSITIPDSVISIGKDAFNGCKNLKDVYISNMSSWLKINFRTVKSNPLNYGANLYLNDKLVENLETPDDVDTIKPYAFHGCSSLKNITLSKSITSVGHFVFSVCTSLQSIRISEEVYSIGNNNFDKNSSFEYLFYDGSEEGWSSTFIDEPNNFSNARKVFNVADGTFVDNVLYNKESTLLMVYGANNKIFTFPNTTKGIDKDAFLNSKIQVVILNDNLQYIGANAFSNANRLMSIYIPLATDTIDIDAFSGCNALTDVYFGGTKEQWNNVKIEKGNDLLKNAKIHFNDKLVEEDGIIYNEAKTDLVYIDSSRDAVTFDVIDSVENINANAFINCQKLQTVNFNSKLKSIGTNAFSACSYLINISFDSDIDFIGDNAFLGCDKLEKIEILGNVNYIGDSAFKYCTSLSSVKFGGNVNTIGSEAFSYCTALTNVKFKGDVNSISDSAFYCCSALANVEFNGDVNTIGNSIFYGCTSLKNVSFAGNVNSMGSEVFSGCSALEEITLPEGMTTISSDFFNGCTMLNRVNFSSSIKTIDSYAFNYCAGLRTISIPGTVKSLGDGVFSNCTSLSSITFNKAITSIGSSAFSGCTALTNVSFASKVNSIGDSAFSGCTALEEITLPEGMTTISSNMFYGCTKLNNVNFSSTINTISSSAFEDCNGLKFISIPDTVTSLGESVFANCTNLERICLPEGTLNAIPTNSFNGCSKLANIYIPENITSSGDSAFLGCNNLSNIYFSGTQEQWNKASKGTLNSAIWSADIHYEHKHTTSDWTVVVPAQKYVDGIETSYCYTCGYVLRRAISCKHQHSYICTVITSASCLTAGFGTFTCECGDSYTAKIDATGHTFTNKAATESNIVSAANCNTKAKYFYKCENCDAFSDTLTFDYGEFNKNNHAGGKEVRDAKTENCGSDGYTGDTYCLGCNTKLETGSVIAATGAHTWDAGEVITPANCVDEGIKKFTCTICSDIKEEKISADSKNHKSVVTVNGTPATCANTGLSDGKTCSACGEILVAQAEISKLAHTEITVSGKPATCTGSGFTDGIVCSECNTVISEHKEITATGHTFSEWTIVKEATYSADGEKSRKCSACNVTETEIIAKLVAKNEEVDTGTNIAIKYADGSFDGEIDIDVTQVFDGASINLINLLKGNYKSVIFDITPTIDGVKTQPNGKVLVGIPLPEGYDKDGTFVYFVGEDGLEKLPSYFENGKIWFETDHFSEYALVDESKPKEEPTSEAPATEAPSTEPSYMLGDINCDGKITATDARIILRISTKLENIEEYPNAMQIADANGDGKITAVDARKVLRVATKLESF